MRMLTQNLNPTRGYSHTTKERKVLSKKSSQPLPPPRWKDLLRIRGSEGVAETWVLWKTGKLDEWLQERLPVDWYKTELYLSCAFERRNEENNNLELGERQGVTKYCELDFANRTERGETLLKMERQLSGRVWKENFDEAGEKRRCCGSSDALMPRNNSLDGCWTAILFNPSSINFWSLILVKASPFDSTC